MTTAIADLCQRGILQKHQDIFYAFSILYKEVQPGESGPLMTTPIADLIQYGILQEQRHPLSI
jgi:hypothetical protein